MSTPPGQPCVAADAGSEQLAASPVAACVGRFSGTTFGKGQPENSGPIGSNWLHRTSEGCLLGKELVLRADGTAIKAGVTGTWTGDELYFRTEIDDRITDFTRTEAERSK